MLGLKSTSKPALAFIVISTALFIYLILRAIFVPLVHDEAATFFHYIHMGRFLPFEAHWDANNHMLNSLLGIAFTRLFGNSELVLRMANLLSFPFYMYFIYRISGLLSSKILRWAFILAMCFAHGFIEFFAYTRGYGLSMALLSGAVWHLSRVFSSNHWRYYIYSLLFITMAQSANLTLVNTSIVVIILLLFKAILKIRKEKIVPGIVKYISIIFLGIVPLILFAYISFILKEKNLLYYGSASGFWTITVESQLDFIFSMNKHVLGVLVIMMFAAMSFIFMFLVFIRGYWKKLDNCHFLFFYLLVSNILATVLLNAIYQVNYPEDRTGMYLYFYFTGAFVFLLDEIRIASNKWIALMTLPLFLVPVDFLFSMNLMHASIWPIDRIPHRYYAKIKSLSPDGDYPPSIGGYHLRHFCWSYLCFKDGGHYPQIFWGSYPGLETDFQIVKAKEIPGWRTYYDSLDYDRISGLYLLKRKVSLEKKFLFESEPRHTNGPDTLTYISLFEDDCIELHGKTIYMELDIRLNSEARPFRAWIVAEIVNENHENLRYEFIALDWLKAAWKGEQGRLRNVMLMHDIPDSARTLKVYLWNIDGTTYEILSSRIAFYDLIKDY